MRTKLQAIKIITSILLILFFQAFQKPGIPINPITTIGFSGIYSSSTNELFSEPDFTGNAPVTMAPEIIANPGEMINAPVKVNGFNNIGAVSLTLHYNPSALTYLTFTNNSGFPGLSANSPVPGTIVIFGFTSAPNGFTLNEGATFFTLKFTFLEGNSGLIWYDDGGSCEYTDPTPMYQPLTDVPTSTYYINGSVSDGSPVLCGVVSYQSLFGTGTPMNNMTIQLKNDNNVALSFTTTNSSGYYVFLTIPAGVTRLEVSSPYSWGGNNSTDALAIQQRTVGIPISFWNPEVFIDKVADVNNSGSINSTDALNVLLRTVGLVNSFEAGDWAYYSEGINLINSSDSSAWINFNGQSEVNIRALCYGDVNGSYALPQPNQLK